MTAAETTKIEVFADYGCPYVHAAAVWLKDVKSELGDALEITWRFFPLDQVNSTAGPEWKVWEQPLDRNNRVQLGFRGAIAAAQQGQAAFEGFHLAWLNARHAMQPGVKPPTAEEVATDLGLDLGKFDKDLNDPALWATIGPDYERGLSEFGVFGTPTIVFPDGSAAYLKMRPAPPAADAVQVWHEFVQTVTQRSNIREIKRPSKPDRP